MPGPAVPPDDVDMDSFAEDHEHCYGPPAHIAARFYRKSSARRRSSAHSSRRSSLSSLSHQSTLSCHGGPRSTHIAQHLRRASIIESRKARLADRAAHAEQVRLRAAIAKAAPRAVYREERALAAQAAREKLLAEITARCEEEVRRAKKVAEETREKKAAEHARLKEEMAEKLADAARRRSIYQHTFRRPRTASLAAVEEKKVSPTTLRKLGENAAAKVIQRSWRARRRARAIAKFVALNVTLPRVQTLSFEEVTKLISEQDILSVTGHLLKVLGLVEVGSDPMSDQGSVRIFLSMYLILAHPVQAFSHGGKEPQEVELMAKGRALLECWDTAVGKTGSKKSNSAARLQARQDLAFLFQDFTSSFHVWRSQDLGVIVDVMVSSFVNLDLILQATKNDRDGHVADDYLEAVRTEQVKLLVRLKKLAGPEQALSRVRTAVRKARKQYALQTKVSDQSIPRTSTAEASTSSLTPTVPGEPVQVSTATRSSPAAAPTSLVSRLGQTMTVLPSNREIAHEIQINGTYEIQQQPWTDSRQHLLDSLRVSMRESMDKDGPGAAADWTHAMAVLIKDKLMNLISPRHPLYDRIDGFLDPKLISQQCHNGLFSYHDFFATIAALIAQLCSPGRDAAIRAFAEDDRSDTIDRLFTLINLIDLMTLDHINFQFRMAAPSVVEHGHQHEHSCFEHDLHANLHSLSRTRQWWTAARSSLRASNPSLQPAGQSIYARALTDLVFSNSPLGWSSLPETLDLDWIRLLSLRARTLRLVATASILLTTKIRLRRNRESLWTHDAERLLGVDLLAADEPVTVARVVSLVESSHNMPESTKEGLLDFVRRVLPPAIVAARNAARAERERITAIQDHRPYTPAAASSTTPSAGTDVFTEQVSTHLLKSLHAHVFARLAAGNTQDRVRATASAAEVLARAGMPEFVAEVAGLVDLLEKIRAADLRAHARWLDEIAAE